MYIEDINHQAFRREEGDTTSVLLRSFLGRLRPHLKVSKVSETPKMGGSHVITGITKKNKKGIIEFVIPLMDDAIGRSIRVHEALHGIEEPLPQSIRRRYGEAAYQTVCDLRLYRAMAKLMYSDRHELLVRDHTVAAVLQARACIHAWLALRGSGVPWDLPQDWKHCAVLTCYWMQQYRWSGPCKAEGLHYYTLYVLLMAAICETDQYLNRGDEVTRHIETLLEEHEYGPLNMRMSLEQVSALDYVLKKLLGGLRTTRSSSSDRLKRETVAWGVPTAVAKGQFGKAARILKQWYTRREWEADLLEPTPKRKEYEHTPTDLRAIKIMEARRGRLFETRTLVPQSYNPRLTSMRIKSKANSGMKLNMKRVASAMASGGIASNLYFRRKTEPKAGGTVLIDASGSMAWGRERLEQVTSALPYATVAYYSGDDTTGWGELTIYAKDGKRFSGEHLDGLHGGNGCDYYAVDWLLSQPKPWVFVTDEQFIGGRDEANRDAAKALLRDHYYEVLVISNANDALKFVTNPESMDEWRQRAS